MMRTTRRRLLAGIGTSVVLSTFQSVLSGPVARAARAAMPDRLVIAQGAEPASLHPLLETGLVEASAYGNIYDPLVTHDAEGRLISGLAESWEQRDERSWIFRLRPGVTFHGGEVFDSLSVRYTIEKLLDPASVSPIRAQLDAIERVETPDPQTAVIVTKQPFAPLIAEVTQVMMLLAAYTARIGFAGLADRPNGTGAYRFMERVPGERIVLEANDRLWSGAPLTFETPQGRYPKDDEVAQAIAGFLENVGFHVQIRVMEWGAYLRKLQAGEGEHLFLLAGTNRTFDPHFTIVRLYGNTSVFGRAYYGSPEVDPLIVQAATQQDPDRRRALYARILAMLRADVPALWLAQLDDLYALSAVVEWQPRADSLVWLHGREART